MKAPQLKDLGQVQPEDQFSKTVQVEAKKASTIVKVSFSIGQKHIDYINRVALELSNQSGRPIKASAALRFILDRDMEADQ